MVNNLGCRELRLSTTAQVPRTTLLRHQTSPIGRLRWMERCISGVLRISLPPSFSWSKVQPALLLASRIRSMAQVPHAVPKWVRWTFLVGIGMMIRVGLSLCLRLVWLLCSIGRAWESIIGTMMLYLEVAVLSAWAALAMEEHTFVELRVFFECVSACHEHVLHRKMLAMLVSSQLLRTCPLMRSQFTSTILSLLIPWSRS